MHCTNCTSFGIEKHAIIIFQANIIVSGLNHIVCLCSHMFILVLTVKLFTALLFFRKRSTDAKTVFILLKIQIGLYISHLIEVFEPTVLIFLFGPLPTKGFQSDTQIRMVPVNTICVTIEIHLTRISM